MLDQETTVYYAGALDKKDKRACVEMHDRGLTIRLYFTEGDAMPDEIRVIPGDGTLDPAALSGLMPNSPLFVKYAQALLRHDNDDVARTAQMMREVGATRRGLPDEFFRLVAGQYKDLLKAKEPYPVKTISEMHWTTISSASRWIKEARRRGYIS